MWKGQSIAHLWKPNWNACSIFWIWTRVRQPLLKSAAFLGEAKPEAQVACLEFLQHRGCQCSADGREMVVSAESPEVPRCCFERVRVQPWDNAMHFAVTSNSLACMQLLYDAGYEQHSSRDAHHQPAVYAINRGRLFSPHAAQAGLLLAVSRSGVPDAPLLNTARAIRGSDDVLRFVRGLGFTIQITNTAAEIGNAGALRYALENGAPSGATTFGAAYAASCRPSQVNREMCLDCLECLRCLHEHARAAGFPKK
eukprot:jgi/Botrbrau1/17163/Bobra.0157s0057.1